MKHSLLKQLRLKAGKTKKEMSELCDVSVNTYTKYENDTDGMPHGLYLHVLEYLETSSQIRKKIMSETIPATARFLTPEERDQEDKRDGYTVPIPEDLTEEFHPSQPITPKQIVAWETKGIEPYPGYEEEENNWAKRWEEVNRAQLAADGGGLHVADPVDVDPEFDPETGEPVTYDEPQMVVEKKGGETRLYVDEADLTEEELSEGDITDSREGE